MKSLGQLDPNTYKHHHMTALICGMVVKDFSWSTKETTLNLVTACYIHDIGKSKYPAIAYKKLSELNEKEVEQYKCHSIDGVDLIKKDESINQNVIRIIAEHHEYGDGSGLPRNLDAGKIHRLAKVLRAVDEFVIFMTERNLSADLAIEEFMIDPARTKKLDKETLDNLVLCFME